MRQRLSQCLRQERRRAGFSQREVAYLIGARARTKISRYERGMHFPPLPIALAYEALLGVPVARLFPAAFRVARRDLMQRARRRSIQVRKSHLREKPKDQRSSDQSKL